MPKNKVQAIAECRCPKCRSGKIFKYTLIEKPFNPLATNTYCPVCHFKFEIEPGFFWAAMYISYAINVAIMISILVAINVLFDTRDPLHYIVPVIGAMLLVYPFTMRYARVLLLHFFANVKFEPELSE